MFNAVVDNPRLLLPKYWLTWIGYWLLCLLMLMPHSVRMAFGRSLGRLAFSVAKSRRIVVKMNLELCFPELENAERDKLAIDVFESGGMGIIETAISWIGGDGPIQHTAELVGLENLQQAQAKGNGVIMLGSHMSTLDLAGTFLCPHIDIKVMYRKNPNELIDAIMLNGRQNNYHDAIERNDIKGVIRALKKGEIVWYGPDQDYGTRNAVFTPFFGVEAATMTAVTRLSQITGAAVVPFSHYRIDNGAAYRVELEPAWQDFPGETQLDDARRINDQVEKVVRRAPEQYWWFHRRFKSRPPNEPMIY